MTNAEGQEEAAKTILAGFEAVGCEGALHAVDLASGADLSVRGDVQVVMASTFKVLVALEFYAQVFAGRIDAAKRVRIDAAVRTPGPVGLSNFRDEAEVSLRDLAYLMMTISDNAATDRLIREVGLDAINRRALQCGCRSTVVESDLQTMLDGVGREMGYRSYAELLAAQSGKLGESERIKSTDPSRLGGLSALNPTIATRTTPRDMTRLLAEVWENRAARAEACGMLREVMAQQVTRRLGAAVPDGGSLAAKSGGLFGRIRNEIGVVGYPDGKRYAVAVFTRAHVPFVATSAVNAEMARSVRKAIEALRA